ncbi:MAG: hypothetical protein ABR567_09300 [Myxococcales bacterium]|nr:hypothetical protein [Myxococcales bacterium]
MENYSRKRIRASQKFPGHTFLDAEPGANDGIVPERSARRGRFLGSLPADHMGEIDRPLGYTPDFDARAFYTSLPRKFRDEGW